MKEYAFENVNISEGTKTPAIYLNKDEGSIKIRGVSIPENSKSFYENLILWVADYAENPQPKTSVLLALRYMNTSTTMVINKVLRKLDLDIQSPNELEVEWIFEEDDNEMKDVGEFYQELLSHKLFFTEVEEI